jgi:hypothetical protein
MPVNASWKNPHDERGRFKSRSLPANGKGPVQLTCRQWAREFHLSHMTLFRALKKHGEEPDSRGRYTAGQVIRANWGPDHAERIGLLREKIESIRAKTAERMAGLIPVKELKEHNETVFGPIAQEINSMTILSLKQKSGLLRHLPL